MKKKKFIAKRLSFILCLAFVLNNMLAVSAGDLTVTERNYEQIEVIYNAASIYSVIIPKQIELNANKQSSYSIQVTGDIAFNQKVYVAPVDAISQTDEIDFYMKDKTSDSNKADVIATITQNKKYWSSEDVANSYRETNNSISAPDLSAGSWSGTFQVEISLETEGEHTHSYVDGVCTECGAEEPSTEHTHTYVDGKCECGEVDPNHEHNYEDGTCTICGKEKTDPYEVAPASAYSNWNYTLDDVNNTITLNYYNGSETDVIVYGSYEINGKLYSTKIASYACQYANSVMTRYMFDKFQTINHTGLKSVVFSDNIDTSDCTAMQGMFYNCANLESVDFGNNFDVSNVKVFNAMFSGCSSLKTVEGMNNWTTGNDASFYDMFYRCKSLTSLDLSGLDTSKVAKMDMMFSGCTSLTDINLSNWDTSNVTSFYAMFYGCSSLASLDLSSFDTGKATNMSNMFRECTSLAVVYVSDTWISKATDMFYEANISSVTYK